MLSYCLECRKNTENINPKISLVMVNQWYYQTVLYVAVKNQNLSRKEEADGLLSSLGIKTTLNKISLVGPRLF